MSKNREFKQRPMLVVGAKSIALVAAVFSLIVCVLLIADFVKVQQMDPLNDPHLLELRKQLADSTGDNEALVQQVRTFDFYARRAFFSSQEQRRTGGWLLLGGAIICFIALKFSKLWKPKLPTLGKPELLDHWELNSLFRQLMAGTGIVLVAVSLFLAFTVQSDLEVVMSKEVSQASSLPQQSRQDGGDTVATTPQASNLFDQFTSNWPSLRGSGNMGVAHSSELPPDWDVESGEGVLWKVEVPVHGYNSPIVWNDRVFLTGADEEGQEVFCFDANTGEELWTQTIETDAELPEVSEDTGLAASTMATDGQRAFAIFASGELAALDFDGSIVWQKQLGVPDNPYGMGSSLLSDGERLFVQYDHNENQKVMAFDGATGQLVWEKARMHISWSSPSLIEVEGRFQLILNDEEHVTSYDPVTGKQLWQIACLGGEVAPSPAFNGKDILFVGNEYAQASAIKLTGGAAELLWEYDDYLPEIASPVASEKFAFIPTTVGDLVCLDILTGETYWEQEFDEGFSSSPIIVGDRLYIADIEGVFHIISVSAEFEKIATVEMGEPVYSTPAFVNNRIYIRTDYDLYCIGKKGKMKDE